MENTDIFAPHPKYGEPPIDTYFVERIQEIVNEYGITTIVETGVHLGNSTVFFAQTVDKVFGVEISQESINFTKNRLDDYNLNNVELIKGNSPIVLLSLMHKIDVEKTLFFLDAHWGAYWPLLDEIDTISRNKGILVIHDAQVPDHPEFGFDTWNGNALNYDYVKDGLTRWSPNHKIEYSLKHNCHNPRGTMYVFPK
jgi:SAM-dependent methyltransferase